MSHVAKEARRLGILKWEADVVVGHTTFTFLAATKHGATSKAARFVILLSKKGTTNV